MRYLLFLIVSVLLAGCGGQDRAVVREAGRLIAKHRYDQARVVIENALRENPQNPRLLRLQVRCFLHTGRPDFAAAACQELFTVSPRDAVLRQAAADRDPALRLAAVRTLGEIKSADSLAVLAKSAVDADKAVRQAVIQALLKLELPDTLPVLGKLTCDPDWFVRGNAILALGELGGADHVAGLFKMLADHDAYIRKSARLSLQRLATPNNLPAYVPFLADADPAARNLAALILAAAGDPQATPVLVAELNNSASPDLPEIIQTVAKIGTPDALPALRQLAAADGGARLYAILALGDYQDTAVAGLLREIQKNPDTSPEIKTACLVALQKIAPPSVKPTVARSRRTR
ncbi:MAG: HEAT repeat domain-containing protein [Verrucomicrobiales bacterium]|jgi:HEAT repeat protein|nr:HEAT repeat domain-containing protein [Verrucomicrobiales bacterium]